MCVSDIPCTRRLRLCAFAPISRTTACSTSFPMRPCVRLVALGPLYRASWGSYVMLAPCPCYLRVIGFVIPVPLGFVFGAFRPFLSAVGVVRVRSVHSRVPWGSWGSFGSIPLHSVSNRVCIYAQFPRNLRAVRFVRVHSVHFRAPVVHSVHSRTHPLASRVRSGTFRLRSVRSRAALGS